MDIANPTTTTATPDIPQTLRALWLGHYPVGSVLSWRGVHEVYSDGEPVRVLRDHDNSIMERTTVSCSPQQSRTHRTRPLELKSSGCHGFPKDTITTCGNFSQFVSGGLPNWEAELLQDVELSEGDPFTVSDVLSHGIRAVTEWSKVWDQQGAPAKVDSYRAEAYGMLAILCFLRRLAEFTPQMEPWTGILATDTSQSLLETLTVKPLKEENGRPLYAQQKQVTQLDVKCPEWDLLSSILTELQRWPGMMLQHMRGHQDQKTAYNRLVPLSAQLNVDADLMATTYQCEHGMSRPVVLLTDTAGVRVVIHNGSVTKTYDAVMRYQATKPGLAEYIQERYGWSNNVMGNVNWTAHGSSLRTGSSSGRHTIQNWFTGSFQQGNRYTGEIQPKKSALFVTLPRKTGVTLSNARTRADERGGPKSFQRWKQNLSTERQLQGTTTPVFVFMLTAIINVL